MNGNKVKTLLWHDIREIIIYGRWSWWSNCKRVDMKLLEHYWWNTDISRFPSNVHTLASRALYEDFE